jgi:hypothetical protein
MKTLFITTLTALLLVSCGSDDATSTSNSACSDSINKQFIKSGNPAITLDLRNISIGTTQTLDIDINDGTSLFTCTAQFYVSGSNCAGSYQVSNSSVSNGSGDCSIINGVGTYTNTSNTLKLCDNNPPCFEYQGQ